MTPLRNTQRPNVAEEMDRLKDFQRNTVNYVHRRLWLDEDSTGRFLVADEVGLGKTLVGRGVVAKAVDHLWDTPRGKRIDIVYICSNSQIARQNLRRLNVADYEIVEAGRLSMLPLVVGQMRDSKVNILSLTPGTSIDVSYGPGKVRERALLHHLLAIGSGNRRILGQDGWCRFFRGQVGEPNYPWERDSIDRSQIDAEFARAFVEQLKVTPVRRKDPDSPPVLEAAQLLQRRIANREPDGRHGVPAALRDEWLAVIGRMRHTVAKAAVALLDPDLVILDEFQRFRRYLRDDVTEDDGDYDAVELSRTIFEHEGADGRVRVLLLSATPFAMYSAPGEARRQSHEDDFLLTTTFLSDADTAGEIQRRQRIVRDAALGQGDIEEAKRAARQVEKDLLQIMCRTERLALSDDRDGMLTEVELPAAVPDVPEIRALGAMSRLATAVGDRNGVFEYWRSAPYLASVMEGYQVKRRIHGHAVSEAPSTEFVEAVTTPGIQVPWARMRANRTIDLGNAKLRVLWQDLAAAHAHEVPWIPASLPYYEHSGAFARAAAGTGLTKRVVFSSWAVAPRAISMMLSYQAEQASARRGSPYKRKSSRLPLRWEQDPGGRLGSMPLLALVYPSVVLARLGDPRDVAAELGEIPASARSLLSRVGEKVHGALTALPSGPDDGRDDQRWYWAAPLALDAMADPDGYVKHLEAEGRRDGEAGEDRSAKGLLYQQHLMEALKVGPDWLSQLGRRPDDLEQVLAGMAVAGPGTCALRALYRGTRRLPLNDARLRHDAHTAALAFRSLVNSPAIAQLVRKEHPGLDYWRAVLRTCFTGNLQAVLDEYVHMLVESQGLPTKGDEARLDVLTTCLSDAMSQHVGTPQVDLYDRSGTGITTTKETVRTHFAVRYGREQTGEQVEVTEAGIRDAFNSPFWPFVLASTSVGQEGLDFHTYCHAVVHWNLPSNPVDLEQREGRVHRYKGHAVRKNVAADFADAALDRQQRDPWAAVFAAARAQAAARGLDEITPYWVYSPKGGARIERHVIANPLSAETVRLEWLLRMVTAYRLTIGQPRQEDLMHFLDNRDLAEVSWMALNLSPPTTES